MGDTPNLILKTYEETDALNLMGIFNDNMNEIDNQLVSANNLTNQYYEELSGDMLNKVNYSPTFTDLVARVASLENNGINKLTGSVTYLSNNVDVKVNPFSFNNKRFAIVEIIANSGITLPSQATQNVAASQLQMISPDTVYGDTCTVNGIDITYTLDMPSSTTSSGKITVQCTRSSTVDATKNAEVCFVIMGNKLF